MQGTNLHNEGVGLYGFRGRGTHVQNLHYDEARAVVVHRRRVVARPHFQDVGAGAGGRPAAVVTHRDAQICHLQAAVETGHLGPARAQYGSSNQADLSNSDIALRHHDESRRRRQFGATNQAGIL